MQPTTFASAYLSMDQFEKDLSTLAGLSVAWMSMHQLPSKGTFHVHCSQGLVPCPAFLPCHAFLFMHATIVFHGCHTPGSVLPVSVFHPAAPLPPRHAQYTIAFDGGCFAVLQQFLLVHGQSRRGRCARAIGTHATSGCKLASLVDGARCVDATSCSALFGRKKRTWLAPRQIRGFRTQPHTRFSASTGAIRSHVHGWDWEL
mmetsp:Transcript_9356/g.57020  ORF Transcript_9356/g.57020 Transcript_9356/m.57020 type:complete len:202 (-) Transcript_9356:2910-3515(-)